MSPKSFLALALITLVFAAGAAWMVATQDTGTGVRGEGRILFPDLVTKVNDVRRVKVTRGTGTSTLVAEEKDGEVSWKIEELYGYPVPLASVRAVAAGLAQVAVIEAKTTRPEKYPKIHVEDPKGKNSKSARVELFDKSGEKLADLIVGMEKATLSGPGQLYVRKPGEERAWLARGKVTVPEKREGWVNRMIVEVDLPRVRESTLFLEGEKPLRIYKKKERDQDFIVERMPEGYELKELFGAEDIARSIQNLAFEEVKPNSEVGIDLEKQPHVRHITFDGMIIEGWSKRIGKKLWFTFRARINPDPAPVDKVNKEQIAKDIAKINEVNTGWAYTINEFETKNMTKTLESMIQPKPGTEKTATDKAPDEKAPAE